MRTVFLLFVKTKYTKIENKSQNADMYFYVEAHLIKIMMVTAICLSQ